MANASTSRYHFFVFALLFAAHSLENEASCQEAVDDGVRKLAALKETITEGILGKEFRFQSPEIISAPNAAGEVSEYVFPGAFTNRNIMSTPGSSIIERQLQITLIRTQLILSEGDRESVVAACDMAERNLAQLASQFEKNGGAIAGYAQINTMEREVWKPLNDAFQANAERRAHKFGGFISFPPTAFAWTPLSENFPYLIKMIPVGYFPPRSVALKGPVGASAYFIVNIDRKLYTAAKIDKVKWNWGTPYELNPDRPPLARISTDTNYYFRVVQGGKEREFDKTFGEEEEAYEVPLP